MNAIANHWTMRTVGSDDALGWRPDIERLRANCEAARSAQRPDPLAVTEAECWLDLIDAELAARTSRNDPLLKAQLIGWRSEVTKILARLRAIGRAGTMPVSPAGSRAGEDRGRVAPNPPAGRTAGGPTQPTLRLEEAS